MEGYLTKYDVCTSGELENAEHLIYKCHNSAQIWKRVENLISYVEQNRLTISSQHALTGFWQEEARDELLLKNVVISITRYHLWKIRNSIKYDAKLIDRET